MSDKKNKNDKKKMSADDFMKKYLDETDVNKKSTEAEVSSNSNAFDNNIKSDATTRASDLQYFHFDAKTMPLGIFYPEGTKIMVRPAMVKEIQAYSMVEENNFPDVVEKMNDMLAACVRIKYHDGRMSSYMDLKDGDRYYIIFLIRELTFQKGNSLHVNSTCDCGIENSIEMNTKNFGFYEIDSDIEPFYSEGECTFLFETINGDFFDVSPPTIGIQKAFTDYIFKQVREKNKLNMSFLKIIPFTLGNATNITEEGIKKKLNDFQNLSMDSFQFINSAVEKMKFGVEKIKNNCVCGLEVYTEFQFPNGAAGIFISNDSFGKLIKK